MIGFSPEDQISPQGMPLPPAFARVKAIEEAMIRELNVQSWLLPLSGERSAKP